MHTKVCLPHTLSSSAPRFQLVKAKDGNSSCLTAEIAQAESLSALTACLPTCLLPVRNRRSGEHVVPQWCLRRGGQRQDTCSGLSVFCRESKAQSAHTHARLTNQLQGIPVRCCAVNYQDLPARLEWAA